jgi:hypothetical protein
MSKRVRARGLVACALIVLLATCPGCGSRGADSGGQSPTKIVQTQDTPIPTRTLQEPAVTPRPGPTDIPTPRPEPTDTPEAEPELVVGLKEEIFFEPGGGGPPSVCGTPEDGSPLPALTISDWLPESLEICVYGFPLGEEVTVELYAPAGKHVGSESQDVKAELEGRTIFTVDLWWPVGMVAGPWRVVARSASDSVESTFEIGRPVDPASSTMPEGDINPFETHYCNEYTAGEAVVIRGANLEPNGQLRLGIYWFTGNSDDRGLSILSLVREETVTTDAHGDFSTTVFVGASDPSGVYSVVPVTDPGAEWYDEWPTAITCYQVP